MLVASSSTLTTSDLHIGMTCFVCEAMACTTSKPAEKSRSGPAVLATASRQGNPAWQAPRLRVFKAPSRLLQKPAESNIRQRRCGLHQPLRPAISAIVIIVIDIIDITAKLHDRILAHAYICKYCQLTHCACLQNG